MYILVWTKLKPCDKHDDCSQLHWRGSKPGWIIFVHLPYVGILVWWSLKFTKFFSSAQSQHTTHHEILLPHLTELLALTPHNQFSYRAFSAIPPTPSPIGAATKTVSSTVIVVFLCRFLTTTILIANLTPPVFLFLQPQNQSVDMSTVDNGKDLSFPAGGGGQIAGGGVAGGFTNGVVCRRWYPG